MKNSLILWESVPPLKQATATIKETTHFDARGMRRLFGRGDLFDRHHNFQMDIWISRDRRLLMRCWSPCKGIDWCSFEITGVIVAEIPPLDKKKGLVDSWVPEVARKAYETWIQDEF